MYKVKYDASVFHTHRHGQNQWQDMLLSGKSIDLDRKKQRVDYEKCQIYFKDIMILEGELVFKGIDVFGEGIAIDKPDIIVYEDILILVSPPAG